MTPCSTKQYHALLDLTEMLVRQNDLSVDEKSLIVGLAKENKLDIRDASYLIEDMGIVASRYHFGETERNRSKVLIQEIISKYAKV